MIFQFQEGKSLAGMVLAASPELMDPNFYQTLVFVTEHGATGAFGLVMNRPLGKKLGEVSTLEDLPDAVRAVSVFQGGPVKPTGLVIARFQRGNNDEELRCEVLTDPRKFLESTKHSGWVRAFVGYAGWQEGQVEAELRDRAWFVRRPHTAMLEEPVPRALWHAFVSEDQRWRRLLPLLPKATDLN